MKYSFFPILMFVALFLGNHCGLAQPQQAATNLPIDPDTKKIMYRAVVEEPGTPVYLYDKAIGWFGYYYLTPQSVYSVQDKVNGKIEGFGRMKIYYQDEQAGIRRDAGQISYQIKLELKENKYRFTLTDFNLKGASRFPIEKWMNKSDQAYNTNWDSYLYQVDTTMQRLISTLKEKMKPTVIKKDEW
ncbi:MAG: DUF4468 domain-containing protein [Bacteroidota bacterium]